jgi:two-component system, OmpR family, sensor histidine kinase KdpD
MGRGTLRIYLGAAPGVGKTFAMLNEGWRKRERGADVVVGYVETHGREATAAQLRDLEVVPRRRLEHRGTSFEEMDLDAVLARRPRVALVDELAHTNVSGSRNEKRWQDVEELLAAGIEVISTVNVQHLDSLHDVVRKITGIEQRETVPDDVVRSADQIELVDMSPEALRRRMAHGNIYAADKVDAALGNYFRLGNLGALRELALLWVADRVEEALEGYLDAHGIEGAWETRERVVVAVMGAPGGVDVVRRAARMAQRTRGDLVGVHVRAGDGVVARGPGPELEEQRRVVTDLGGQYHEVVGGEVADALLAFARAERATQLVMGASRRTRWAELTRGSVINHVIRDAGDLDVHVISQAQASDDPAVLARDAAPSAGRTVRLRRSRSRPPIPRRRVLMAWAIVVVGVPLLTALLVAGRNEEGVEGALSLYLGLVIAAALVGGMVPATVGAIACFFTANYYLTPPFGTLSIDGTRAFVGLVEFIAVGVVVSLLVTRVAQGNVAAVRARSEAESLARVAADLVGGDDPLPGLLARLRTTFGVDAAAVVVRSPGGWLLEASAGDDAPLGPDDASDHVDLGDGARLVLAGPGLAADDRRVLQVFAAQLAQAREQRALRAEADRAASLASANDLRTALLQAVSHDLRSPLASIKASVTSLLQDDVPWTAEDSHEFLLTIDEETDRLNRLVGNLLDASRVQTGALTVTLRAVGIDEVVAAALGSLAGTAQVVVDVAEDLPAVLVDPALLERTVANVVANAMRWSPPGAEVRVDAGRVGRTVHLRVVDHGPGIAVGDRDRVVEPFQRLGDQSPDTGVGLGLAVASGFVRLMGGDLSLDDTPGGGLTVVLTLPCATAPADATPVEVAP